MATLLTASRGPSYFAPKEDNAEKKRVNQLKINLNTSQNKSKTVIY